MVTCSICYERFTAPVSLPCGHLFCRECVRRTVESYKSSGSENLCPTCRAPYSILKVDPALVPPYLRPHILPPIRPVFFDHPTPTSAPISAPASTSAPELSVMPPSSLHHELTTMAPAPTPTEIAAAAAAELHTLRLACTTWRRRAETHAAVNTRLLSFARGARDCALRMRAERDTERNNYVLLKRKLSDLGPEDGDCLPASSESDDIDPARDRRRPPPPPPPPRAGLPVFVLCNPPPVEPYSSCAASGDARESRLGPPLKRRKESPRGGVLPEDVDKVALASNDPIESSAPASHPACASKQRPISPSRVLSLADILA